MVWWCEFARLTGQRPAAPVLSTGCHNNDAAPPLAGNVSSVEVILGGDGLAGNTQAAQVGRQLLSSCRGGGRQGQLASAGTGTGRCAHQRAAPPQPRLKAQAMPWRHLQHAAASSSAACSSQLICSTQQPARLQHAAAISPAARSTAQSCVAAASSPALQLIPTSCTPVCRSASSVCPQG